MQYQCPNCELRIDTLFKFQNHCVKKHKLDIRRLYIDMFLGGKEPTCACGCGKNVKFHSLSRGMSKFIPGHQSRVNNNWGHNKEALDKSHQTMREKRAEGEYPAWNKGLSKETDERVAAYGRKSHETFQNDVEECMKRSKRMTEYRLSGVVPTLYGPDHPNWKGGTSSLNAAVNADNRLYKEWKFPKLKAADFKCVRCGLSKNLCVHHDKERMATIIHLHVERLGFDATSSDHDLKRKVIDGIVDHHIRENVSGLVLCYTCHEKEHASLNFMTS